MCQSSQSDSIGDEGSSFEQAYAPANHDAGHGAGRNPFWTGVIFFGAAFAVTCLVSVAATFGDPQGPMNMVMTAYGNTIIGTEASLLVVSGLLAMTVDRIHTLRKQR